MFNTLTKLILDEQKVLNQIKELQKQRISLKEQDNLLAVQIIELRDKLRRNGIKKGYYTNNCNLFCRVCDIKGNIILVYELDTIEQLQLFFADNHNVLEKPNKDVEVFVMNGNRIAVCDLFWKDKKIAYFTSDNEEDYQFVRENTNIICFIGNSMDLNAFENLMKEV